jgi:hypothetical protein
LARARARRAREALAEVRRARTRRLRRSAVRTEVVLRRCVPRDVRSVARVTSLAETERTLNSRVEPSVRTGL